MEDRPLKKGKRNFFTPNETEKVELKIKKSWLKKKEKNLERIQKLEKKIKTDQDGLSQKIQSLKPQQQHNLNNLEDLPSSLNQGMNM